MPKKSAAKKRSSVRLNKAERALKATLVGVLDVILDDLKQEEKFQDLLYENADDCTVEGVSLARVRHSMYKDKVLLGRFKDLIDESVHGINYILHVGPM